MTIPDPMPVLSEEEQSARLAAPEMSGVQVLIGSVVDTAGVVRAKSVPLRRAGTFHVSGVGAAPTWNVFCIDNAIAFTDRLGVVGDLRLRIDLTALHAIGGGYAWAPAEFFDQEGQPAAACTRGRLRHVQALSEAAGLTALIGHELEFALTTMDGQAPSERDWQAYGLGAVLERGGFIAALASAVEGAGVPVEQVHAEYGTGQFELSLAPANPLLAADRVVLARLLVGQVAREHGMRVSFSPLPFHGGAGNGAHLHLSLAREGEPLLSGGTGAHGLTEQGSAALAGIVHGLPEMLGVFAGSLLSGARLCPGLWSGAFACWGLENREAAVRLIAATHGNPHGANIELKCVDPSANVYLATAVLLGLALDGIGSKAVLPEEVCTNPADDPAAVRLPAAQATALDALAGSTSVRGILGEDIVDALLAVRRHEQHTYARLDPAELAERFRFAWSS